MDKKKKRIIYLSAACFFNMIGTVLFFSFCDSDEKTRMFLPACSFMLGTILSLIAPDAEG